MRIGKDLVAAAAAPLVLSILAEGESYGYALQRRIAQLSDGRLEWSDGMLYPLLHRLERIGQIESSWKTSPTGRPRKVYRLRSAGVEALADHRRQWTVVNEALARIWDDRASAAPNPAGA